MPNSICEKLKAQSVVWQRVICGGRENYEFGRLYLSFEGSQLGTFGNKTASVKRKQDNKRNSAIHN